MGLKKGKTNNPAGRPKGTPNKVTTAVREGLKDLIRSEMKELPKICQEMTPRERSSFFIKLLEFVLPKASQEMELKEDEEQRSMKWIQDIFWQQVMIKEEDGSHRKLNREEYDKLVDGDLSPLS